VAKRQDRSKRLEEAKRRVDAVEIAETSPVEETDLLAPVRTALLSNDRAGAEAALRSLLLSKAGMNQWNNALNNDGLKQRIMLLVGMFQDVTFTNAIPTACVSLRTRRLWISPIFFLRHIKSWGDFLFLLLHEKEHLQANMMYGQVISYAEFLDPTSKNYDKQVSLQHIKRNYIEDVWANAKVRRNLRARHDLSKRYYADPPKGDQKKVELWKQSLRASRGALLGVRGDFDLWRKYTQDNALDKVIAESIRKEKLGGNSELAGVHTNDDWWRVVLTNLTGTPNYERFMLAMAVWRHVEFPEQQPAALGSQAPENPLPMGNEPPPTQEEEEAQESAQKESGEGQKDKDSHEDGEGEGNADATEEADEEEDVDNDSSESPEADSADEEEDVDNDSSESPDASSADEEEDGEDADEGEGEDGGSTDDDGEASSSEDVEGGSAEDSSNSGGESADGESEESEGEDSTAEEGESAEDAGDSDDEAGTLSSEEEDDEEGFDDVEQGDSADEENYTEWNIPLPTEDLPETEAVEQVASNNSTQRVYKPMPREELPEPLAGLNGRLIHSVIVPGGDPDDISPEMQLILDLASATGEASTQNVDFARNIIRQVSETVVGNILAARAKNDHTRPTLFPTITRRTAVMLGMGQIPTMYEQHVDEHLPPIDLYVDVSGSMERYYVVIPKMVKMLAGNVGKVYQFSDDLWEVDTEETRLFTTGGTSYRPVAKQILESGATEVIVLTDNTCDINQEVLQQLGYQLTRLVLISTAKDRYSKRGFDWLVEHAEEFPALHAEEVLLGGSLTDEYDY
jgi:hypothetical protein